jgi:hypothetical protein
MDQMAEHRQLTYLGEDLAVAVEDMADVIFLAEAAVAGMVEEINGNIGIVMQVAEAAH